MTEGLPTGSEVARTKQNSERLPSATVSKRLIAIDTGENRKGETSDTEQLALYRSLLTFSGRYRLLFVGGHFRFWHIASVGTVQRHVRSWGKVGSGWPTVKAMRMTRLGHWTQPDSGPVGCYNAAQFPEPLSDQRSFLDVIMP